MAAQNWLNDYPGSSKPMFIENHNPIGMPETHIIKTSDSGQEEPSYSLDSYTKISVGNITPTDDTSIFLLTAQQLKILLLGRTAAGVTKQLFNPAEPLEFDLYLTTNLNTGSMTVKVNSSYIKPHELVTHSNRISYRQ